MAQEIGAGHGAEPFADLDPPDRDSAERLGRALGGEFQVRRLVGRGGFARVFEVFDAALDRRLAVKVLRSDVPWGPASITRFKQEARAIARLSHPNILPIHFVGEAEGLGFYAMPFLEGRPLTALILDGPLQPARALGIAEPMLGALQHAHANGIVHRDIKPDNIMIEAGTERPLLVDFGIAKAMDGDGTQTEAGFIVGTPLYMSPEQAMGCGKVDARSDLYAMGVVLFHMLSGAPPFHGGDSQEIMGRHLTDPVPLNRLGDRGTPRWLADIVGRCLTKHPDDRYPSAVAVLDALRAGREAAGFPAPVFGIPTPQPAGPRSVQGAPPGSAAPTTRLKAAGRPALRLLAARPSRRTVRRGAMAAGVVLVVSAAGIALRPRPELVVENRLGQPIALTVDDRSRMIGAGDSVRLPIAAGEPLEAHWAMVRATHRGVPLGAIVEGTITADRPVREIREVVDAGSDGQPRFLPFVLNGSGRPLTVVVEGSGVGARCDCLIAPGDSLALGYYPLSGATAVRVSDDLGRVYRFTDLDDDADRPSGRVDLRVREAELGPRPEPRRGTRAVVRRRSHVRDTARSSSNPLGAFLPVR